jgi:hypothetical protein
MSKLKILFLGIAVCMAFSYAFFSGPHTFFGKLLTSFHDSENQDNTDRSDIWGKARGPALVKIVETDKTDTVVVLTGMIQSQMPELKIEWKLPEGAELLDGESQAVALKNQDGSYDNVSISVDISSVTTDEPIVFSAFFEKDGERHGHTRIYKINKSEADAERIENVKSLMKARGSKLVR